MFLNEFYSPSYFLCKKNTFLANTGTSFLQVHYSPRMEREHGNASNFAVSQPIFKTKTAPEISIPPQGWIRSQKFGGAEFGGCRIFRRKFGGAETNLGVQNSKLILKIF